jgi:hypothetical protein
MPNSRTNNSGITIANSTNIAPERSLKSDLKSITGKILIRGNHILGIASVQLHSL